jgi:hypothetical protein
MSVASMDVVINRLCISMQLPSEPWAISSDGPAAHCTTVACWETSIHYNIYGLQVKSF